MSLVLFDAHNHLQDKRLAPSREALWPLLQKSGVARMVVNGSCEADWPEVLALAQQWPGIIPSFGYHPWYVKEQSAHWRQKLLEFLDAMPSAVGEIGLDRWIDGFDAPRQEEAFLWQMRLAAERNLPASIHCLRAWGRLREILQSVPRPHCGFLLHSYGGAREMVEPLAELGAYFSLPGCFAGEGKEKKREAFLAVPPERLLIETDAPDQCLPEARVRFPLRDAQTGKPLNHPANLEAVYSFAAELYGEPLEKLAERVRQNFLRLFGGVDCSLR